MQIQKALANHAFFKRLDPQFAEKAAAYAKAVRFDESQYVFHRGEDANRFYLIQKGLITLGVDPKHHSQVDIQTVTDDEVLGWSWLIPPYIWQFDAHVTEPTTAIELDAVQLRKLFEVDHEMGYVFARRVLQVVSKRLQATRIQFWDIYKMHYFLEHNVQ